MNEEAAQSPHPSAAPTGGSTPPGPATVGSPAAAGPQAAGPGSGDRPTSGADPASGPAGYGPGPGASAGPVPGAAGGAGVPGAGGAGVPGAGSYGAGGAGAGAGGYGPGGAGPGAPFGYGAAGFGPAGGSGAAGGGGTPPPAGGPAGAAGGPPPGAAGFTTRYGLVRPRDGRYLAGVCAAIGRATNTDPVLWRVLLAVLGFFGGVGILVYIAAWLIIPGEGDSASPVESMLGRGRSSMSPITVIVLSIVAAVGFGYIVTDAFRAVLLGAAILIGGALLLNRQQRGTPPAPAAAPPPAAPPGPVPPVAYPAPDPYAAPPTVDVAAARGAPAPGVGAPAPSMPVDVTASHAGPASQPGTPVSGGGSAPVSGGTPLGTPGPVSGGTPVGGTAPVSGAAPIGVPGPVSGGAPIGVPAPVSAQPADRTAELPAWPPAAPPVGTPQGPGSTAGWPAPPAGAASSGGQPATTAYAPTAPLPSGGYRPPFAPHGPYASQSAGGQLPPPPPKPAKQPKRPKERSPLGAVTFSLIFLALGAVAVLDLVNAFDVGASAYFAAALATIGLGLLVGTWFGRARWLIALGMVTAAALAVGTVAESYDRFRGVDGAVTWAPASYQDLATRYENSLGDAVLDLRAVDFDKRNTEITVSVNLGKATVVVPPNVDVTTVADVNAGDATIFGRHQPGPAGRSRESTDLGPDGAGGGTLRLFVHINAGSLVVTR
ncbi:PspC domain-containing protein [Micromonospora costi]|uniref:PspC domain-containing protein n=1 Tax=Micromonospora costi TaxID=1530042 RepID=UPI0033F64F44